MKDKLYRKLAMIIDTWIRCVEDGNDRAKIHKKTIEYYQDMLPSGSGFDSGCEIDLEESNGEKIVIYTSFHHMNDGGYYDGWTAHKITIKPSLRFGYKLIVSGENRNDIKDYIHDVFSIILNKEVE